MAFYLANPPFSLLQILYPIALAAAIFSMQPGAIPFDLTPKSFALAIFILIAIVYAIRLLGKHAQPHWPLLRDRIAVRLKKTGRDRDVGVNLENGSALRDRLENQS